MTQTIFSAINSPFCDLVEFAFLCVIGFTAGSIGALWIFLPCFFLFHGQACFISGACFGEIYLEVYLLIDHILFKIQNNSFFITLEMSLKMVTYYLIFPCLIKKGKLELVNSVKVKNLSYSSIQKMIRLAVRLKLVVLGTSMIYLNFLELLFGG